jgi:hypothetical protein
MAQAFPAARGEPNRLFSSDRMTEKSTASQAFTDSDQILELYAKTVPATNKAGSEQKKCFPHHIFLKYRHFFTDWTEIKRWEQQLILIQSVKKPRITPQQENVFPNGNSV